MSQEVIGVVITNPQQPIQAVELPATGEVGFAELKDVGPQGLSGYSGFSGLGLSGYSGSGISGYSGESGLSGYSGSGVSGYSGISGFSGSGISGYSGYSGTGLSGYSGYSGAATSGFSGSSGISGYSGSGVSGYSGSGISGYSGSGISGYSGAGLSGFSGFSSTSGFSGQSGYSGFSGSGVSGYSGSGISGYSGAGLSGFSGFSSASGFSGQSGYSGSGISGYSGAGTSGYSGYSGQGGITASLWQYRTDTSSITGNPASGRYQYDNATQTSAANLYFNSTTSDGFDITIFLNQLIAGQDLYIQDANNAANFQKWIVNGSISNPSAGVYQVPVGLITSGGTGTTNFPDNHQMFIAVLRIGASGYSGFSGKSGYSGYSGSGVSGYSGFSGTGTSGYSGFSGAGTSGYSGFSGATGGTAGRAYYPENSVSSDLSGYKVASRNPSPNAESDIVTTAPTSGLPTLAGSFATIAGEPNITSLPSGTAYRYIYADTSTGSVQIRTDLFRYKNTGNEATTGAISLTYSAAAKTIVRGSGDFTADGFTQGAKITVSGTSSNNGTFTIQTVVALTITLIQTDTLVNETATSTVTTKERRLRTGNTSTFSDASLTLQVITYTDANSYTFASDDRIIFKWWVIRVTGTNPSVTIATEGTTDQSYIITTISLAAVGTSGYSGYSGYSGSGVSGYSGFSGAGTSGFSGFSGAGTSGYSGYSGAGTSGYSGFSGAGTSGYSGFSAASPGASGYSGYSGLYGGNSQPYVFDSGTADSDPGSGRFRFNNAVLLFTTKIFVSNLNSLGTDLSAAGNSWIPAFLSGDPTRGLEIVITKQSDPSVFAIFHTNSAYTDASPSPYAKVNGVVFSTGSTPPFSNNDPVFISVSVGGSSGYSGYSGAGTSGFSGFSGAGTSGYSGYSAASPGASGYSGYSGAGTSGYSGFSAATPGASGYSGYSGTIGTSGYSGYSGISAYSGYSGAGGGWTSLFVTGSNFTTTSTNLTNITGLLTGTLTNSQTYECEVRLFMNSSTAAGFAIGVTCGGTGAAGAVFLNGLQNNTNSSGAIQITAPDVGSTTFQATATDGAWCGVGFITTRSTGTANIAIQIRKTTSGTATVYVGSSFKYRVIGT